MAALVLYSSPPSSQSLPILPLLAPTSSPAAPSSNGDYPSSQAADDAPTPSDGASGSDASDAESVNTAATSSDGDDDGASLQSFVVSQGSDPPTQSSEPSAISTQGTVSSAGGDYDWDQHQADVDPEGAWGEPDVDDTDGTDTDDDDDDDDADADADADDNGDEDGGNDNEDDDEGNDGVAGAGATGDGADAADNDVDGGNDEADDEDAYWAGFDDTLFDELMPAEEQGSVVSPPSSQLSVKYLGTADSSAGGGKLPTTAELNDHLKDHLVKHGFVLTEGHNKRAADGDHVEARKRARQDQRSPIQAKVICQWIHDDSGKEPTTSKTHEELPTKVGNKQYMLRLVRVGPDAVMMQFHWTAFSPPKWVWTHKTPVIQQPICPPLCAGCLDHPVTVSQP
ncbi:hypothetical protein CF319_g7049 [Tilletia indica]|nr:hypothetical protein CF319_g7049 [Tilletia indica]